MHALRIGLAVLAAMTLLAPSIGANHGTIAVYKTDDNSFSATGAYMSGDGTAQTWSFVTSDGQSCDGFGSIESGFVGPCITASGTNHRHNYPYLNVDIHAVTINGLPGTVVTTV